MPRSDSHNNGGRGAAVQTDSARDPLGLGLEDFLPDSPSDESEALAELFLGEPTSVELPAAARAPSRQFPPPHTAPSTAAIEGMVLGHLPVLASAWVQQYARHVASELQRPVALLRLRAGEATLELVSGSGIIHQPTGHAPASLADALAAAAREASLLLVRTDETTEPRLAELAGLDTLTLLSGADEAATVASYRTIKNLTASMDDESRQPAIRLAIMGATPPQAMDAATRIERAAAAFLDRRITVHACISKIGGGKSTPLYKGSMPQPVEAILQALRQMFIPSAPRSTTPREPLAPPRSPAVTTPVAQPPLQPEPPAADEPVVSRIGHLAPTRGSVRPTGTPQASVDGSVSAATKSRLCDHIPGLTPATLTCPYAPSVEFALGADGNLHILAPQASSGLADLLTAAAWTRAHEQLLRQALTKGPHAERWSAEPVLHLFTTDAAASRHLADAPIRLHLLAQVNAGGHSAWLAVPLN